MITPVIVSGGSGERLWPLSRTQCPKQFLSFNGDRTMLQETVVRLAPVDTVNVVCNEEHRFLAAEQMRQMGQKCSVLLEPVGRNTAPAIALAALHSQHSDELLVPSGEERKEESPILLVLAADHVIDNVAALRDAIASAEPLAEAGKLVTFGIVPTHPETGYGYIKADVRGSLSVVREEENNHSSAHSVFSDEGLVAKGDKQASYLVTEFVEKPNLETAEVYVSSGDYYWNSGMFMFRADRYLEELGKFRPDILEPCQAAMQATSADMDFIRVDAEAFAACPDESIDYAVMEPLCGADGSDSVVVVPLDAGWSDVGSWSALWDIKDKDAENNVAEGDVILQDTSDSFVFGQDRLVTTLGVDNLVIVDTKDALLVASKDRVQDVKSIVSKIKDAKRIEHHQHREVYRPWGKFDSIDTGERYQVKRITVNPGAKLSLQKHHHRAEHWVVVSGTARVRRGDEAMLISENESTYIPIGEVHSLENPGRTPLELIEVQSGSYLGEDDIVRLEDDYGRVEKP